VADALTDEQIRYLRQVWYQTPELYWEALDEATGNTDRYKRRELTELVWRGTQQYEAFHAAGGRKAVPMPEGKKK
jgi:hypothetical protein